MVHHHQVHLVQVGRFPQLLGKLQKVEPIPGLQESAGDLEVLISRIGETVGHLPTHNAQRHTDGTAPMDIGYHGKLIPIPGIQEGTGSLQDLVFHDHLIFFGIEPVLAYSIGPDHPYQVSAFPVPQTEVGHRAAHEPHLIQAAGFDLHLGADAEVVILTATGTQPGQPYYQIVINIATVITQQVDALETSQEDIQIAIIIVIGDFHLAAGLQVCGQ